MRRYSKRDRIRSLLALLGAFKARLAERDADIRRCRQAAMIESGEEEETFGLALQRFERTRKALAWIERGLGLGAVRHGEMMSIMSTDPACRVGSDILSGPTRRQSEKGVTP